MGLFSNIGGAIAGAFGGAAGVGLPQMGAALLGGGMDLIGQRQQNIASAQQASQAENFSANQALLAEQFSASQAQKQMDFQERMSGTAHQREVADLKAAGLNPMLSVNSGASSPSGASGSGFSASGVQAPVVPEISSAVSSAMDALRLTNDYMTASAQREAARANAANSLASAKQAGVQTELLRKKGPEASVNSKVWGFLNGLLDRVSSSASESFRRTQEDLNNASSGSQLRVDWMQ